MGAVDDCGLTDGSSAVVTAGCRVRQCRCGSRLQIVFSGDRLAVARGASRPERTTETTGLKTGDVPVGCFRDSFCFYLRAAGALLVSPARDRTKENQVSLKVLTKHLSSCFSVLVP